MQKRGSLLALYKPLLSRPWQQLPRPFAKIAQHKHERSCYEQPQRGKAGEQAHPCVCAERKLDLHLRAFGKVRAEGEKLLGSLVGVGHYAFTYAGGEGMAYCRANKRTGHGDDKRAQHNRGKCSRLAATKQAHCAYALLLRLRIEERQK